MCCVETYITGDLQTESKIRLNFVNFPLLSMSVDSHVAFWLIAKTISCLGQIETYIEVEFGQNTVFKTNYSTYNYCFPGIRSCMNRTNNKRLLLQ